MPPQEIRRRHGPLGARGERSRQAALSERHAGVRALAAAAIAAVEPGALLRAALADESLRHPSFGHRPVFVVAAGKAGAAMLAACRAELDVARTVVALASHPLPDVLSVEAGEAALALAEDARRADTELVVLLSGGASAMLAAPADGVTLELKRDATRRLLASGASIHEINAVRKHLSRIKGGRLAFGVSCTTFALSDVTDDDPASIGSGPTVPDPSTREDAMRVIERTGLVRDLPEVMQAIVHGGETPKTGDPRLARSRFVLIGGRRTAMDGVVTAALLGEHATIVLDEPITGDASAAGAAFAARARAAAR
ncbi:MAG: glycerate-2-kinase family protein, partial [Acidobacteriota bacterium]|nr:glycerate-2-kinase family protein [Acidobacteriota bacterium]